MRKPLKHPLLRLLIFSLILVGFVAYGMTSSILDYIRTPQEVVESDLKTDDQSEAVKEAICTLKVDKLPVFIYVDRSDSLEVTFFGSRFLGGRETIGFDSGTLSSGSLADDSNNFDNKNGDRVVWGIRSAGDNKAITVNGGPVSSVKLLYTAGGKKTSTIFWYIVLKGRPAYSVKKVAKALV